MNKNKITYRKANRELLKVKQYIDQDVIPALSVKRNLKLYDVSFEAADIIEKYPLVKENYDSNDLFQWFCDEQYDFFKDGMLEKGINIEKLLYYIGQTSSFYINPNRSYDISDYTIMECLYDAVNGGYREVQFSADGMQVKPFINEDITYSNSLDSDIYDLEYIISGKFLQDVKNYFSDCLTVAEYIDNFMKNQISILIDYIEFKNELLEEQEIQEKERQEKEKTDFIVDTACSIFA